MPLKDVADSLSKLAGPVQIDIKAITDAGGSADTPITFRAKQLRLDSALRLMLQEHELDYIIDYFGVLIITSETKAKEHVVINYYPVGDLIGDTSGNTAKEIDEAYAALLKTITSIVAPTTWSDAGGTGSITPFASCKALVCSQTRPIHDEISTLLTDLRAKRAENSNSAAANRPTPAFVTRIIQLAPDHADAAADYVEAIRNLIGTKASTNQGFFVGKVPGAIIARCSPAMHERIELLLEELQALPRPPLGPTKAGGAAPIGGLGGGGSGGAF